MSTIDRETMATLPLEAGQRMDRATFHARYEAMPPGIKAELIGGVVYMPSPLKMRHARFDSLAQFWLGSYRHHTPGTDVLGNASTALDDLGEPQPDVQLRILPECGGQSSDFGGIVGGAPEFVLEVADTSRRVDLGPKLLDYERAGVREYVVMLIDPDEVAWHVRDGDRLVRVIPDADGVFRSKAFPGLWMDWRAFLRDDGQSLIATLDRGIATDEHVEFVAHLAKIRRTIA